MFDGDKKTELIFGITRGVFMFIEWCTFNLHWKYGRNMTFMDLVSDRTFVTIE